MTTRRADDVHPGDVIDYHGELHRITRVERSDGWAWPIAFDDAGWAIALEHSLIELPGEPDAPSSSC
jgi:hypothetical protein